MCGIAGFLDSSHRYLAEEISHIAVAMSDSLHHRGPDDSGLWSDAASGIALSFRRLAILDLSPTGHQPMVSSDGRYVVVFNGEIYNFLEIRQELESLTHPFRGTSDTEVMLAAFSQWGLERAINRFNGMFAFALWDSQEKTLTLARDRLGIKPLYYGMSGGVFIFASELKAILRHPAFQQTIDRDALTLYLQYNCIPAPYSIYKGIHKLIPGTFLRIYAEMPLQIPTPLVYWSASEVVLAGINHPFQGNEHDAISYLDDLLRESIKLRMIADVPLGAFLSGGVDSSTIVAVMQSLSDRPIKTFTIGFDDDNFNEAVYAKRVAGHLGTDHTELYVTPEQAMQVIPKLPDLYDEPFSDSSQIPTYLVSALARGHVTVSLSGDGGDELFGGYNRHYWGRSIWKRIEWIPQPVRKVGAGLLNLLSPVQWERVIKSLKPVLPSFTQQPELSEKIRKLLCILPVKNPEAFYDQLVSHWKPTGELLYSSEPKGVIKDPAGLTGVDDFSLRMMYRDLISYLPDDILVKLDRATMGVSLEGRVPFLDDHHVVEFAWRTPLSMKIRDGQGKWILRQVLYKYVPKELIERPKMGFGVPIDVWLRGALKDWVESLISEDRLVREGYFNPLPIRKKWAEHLEGKINWAYDLWDILMFQSWLSSSSGRQS